MSITAAFIRVSGVVQGVGFRPFVYRLAQEMNVKGWVNNTSRGVNICVEGDNIAIFYQRVLTEAPPLAVISGRSLTAMAPKGFTGFQILESSRERSREVLISPDAAICPDCLKETREMENRRYHYPFTNCTNCGPRYTIISDIPYDRPNTTMVGFDMCPQCEAEYNNPLDRRFHAQPIACPVCGPQTRLQDAQGRIFTGLGVEQLEQGYILAVKGLGGFHLACNARDKRAVERLRERKKRESKPFAVMARNLDVIRRYCFLSDMEASLLTSSAAPILVLQTKDSWSGLNLPHALAPGLNTLGVMLPYTPLHHMLLKDELDLLVMTSANRSGEPLIFQDDEALTRLKGIADYWLTHNRDVYHPCDDSVLRVISNRPVFFRRARGYVPLPQELDTEYPPVLGVGGDIKNTFCLVKKNQAFVSQHGGDLSNYENYQQFMLALQSFQRVVNLQPAAVAYDLHPEYHATRFAQACGLPGLGVQHHHAHLTACLTENGVKHRVLGVICDGTGYGLDGKIWGFEFLWGDRRQFVRTGHLEYLPLPGGDAAARFPARTAAAYLTKLIRKEQLNWRKYLANLSSEEIQLLELQVERGFNVFETSSCGRLFDVVAALVGFNGEVSYEGQAAIELEGAVVDGESGFFPFELDTSGPELLLRIKPLLIAILGDLERGVAAGQIAAKFHNTLARMILAGLNYLRSKYESTHVALSGGVFQNKYLVEILVPQLQSAGFTVYQHSLPGDGGLCLGQVVAASEVMEDVSGNSR